MSEYDGIKMNICFDDELPLIDLKGRFSHIKHASIQTTTVEPNDGSPGQRFYTEDSDGLFSTPDGHVFGPEIMKDIEAAFDAILNEENPDED